MNRRKKIGVFGGTFNPPHYGHLMAALYALKRYELDEVWFTPAFSHAFKTVMVSFEHRRAMLKELIAGLGPRFRISSIEKTIRNSGKALLTLEALTKRYPQHRFHWLIGSDLISETQKWYRVGVIRKKFGFLAIPRGEPLGIPDFQSTRLRKSIRTRKASDMTAESVLQYARRHRLYRS